MHVPAGINHFTDIMWNENVKYGDVHRQSEFEFSHYNFNIADTELHFKLFDLYEKDACRYWTTRNRSRAPGIRLRSEMLARL